MSPRAKSPVLGDLLAGRPEQAVLTKLLEGQMRAFGCEPHCHLCGRRLRVGDVFGFAAFELGPLQLDGIFEGGAFENGGTLRQKLSACKRCLDEHRKPGKVLFEEAEQRRRARDEGHAPPGVGCFFDENGEFY